MNAVTGNIVRAVPKIRVAIYTRQSVDRSTGAEFGSLQAQREAILAYIDTRADEGWQALPQVYEDAGFSGKNTERPAFQQMMADMKSGFIDVIAVYKYDRLARTVHDLSGLLNEFLKYDASCFSITQPMETVSATGRASFNMMSTFAQLERELASERTRDKIRASREKGLWTGGFVSLGYRVKDSRLIIVPDEAERVRDIFGLYVKLGSLSATADELNRRGWKTKQGANWGKSTLSNHLKRVLYCGKVPCNGEVFDGQHKPIIGQGLFDQVQVILANNGHKGGARARNKWNLLLKGLLVCGGCGQPMSHSYSKKDATLYHYYFCRSKKRPGPHECKGASLNAQEIETFVIEKIKGIGNDRSLIEATTKAAKAEALKKKPTFVAEKRSAISGLKKLTKERQGLLKALASDTQATAIITDRLLELDQEKQTLERRREAIEAELDTLKNGAIDKNEIATSLSKFDGIWRALTPLEKQRMLVLLIEEIRFEPDTGDVTINYHPIGLSASTTGRTA